jgi:hypothetical protein
MAISKKKELDLSCEIMEMYIDDDLQLVITHPVEIWDDVEGEFVKAFEVDVDGDLEGVNGYDLEECAEDVSKIRQDLADEILELYRNWLGDNCILTDLDNEVIDLSVQENDVLGWVSKCYLEHYENNYSSKHMVPVVNLLATHPLDSSSVLVAKNCEIKRKSNLGE